MLICVIIFFTKEKNMQDEFMKYMEYLFVTGQLDEMNNDELSEIANELLNDDDSLDTDENQMKR